MEEDERGLENESGYHDAMDTSKVTIRNTWPRKRVRQQVPHVDSIFSSPSECMDQSETSSTTSSTNEVRPGGQMSAMYFVSFDDSVCNGSNTNLNAEHTQRIPRNSKNPLPPGK